MAVEPTKDVATCEKPRRAGSKLERVTGHTGTETRARLLREAAVRNLPQWAQA